MDRLSNVDFADAVGLTRRATTYMSKEVGAPFDRRGWIWPDCLRWYVQREAARTKRAADPTALLEAERRSAVARAIVDELKAAKDLGLTMTVEQYEAELRDAMFRMDAKLKSLLPRLAGASVGIKSPAEGMKRFAPLIEEVRGELRSADDVPAFESHTGTAA